MTQDNTERGLLAQILVEVRDVSAKVSSLEVTNAEVVAEARHRGSQLDDHEARLRRIESVDAFTRQDMEDANEARAQAERARDNRRLALIAILFAAAQLIEGGFLWMLDH